MLTTTFRVWLQDPGIKPDWAGIQLVGWPKSIESGCLEITVKGNGHDLRRLLAKHRDIFTACLQMKPEKHEDH